MFCRYILQLFSIILYFCSNILPFFYLAYQDTLDYLQLTLFINKQTGGGEEKDEKLRKKGRKARLGASQQCPKNSFPLLGRNKGIKCFSQRTKSLSFPFPFLSFSCPSLAIPLPLPFVYLSQVRHEANPSTLRTGSTRGQLYFE